MKIHAVAIFGEIREFSRAADGEVRHLAGAACAERGGQQAQSDGRQGKADGGVEEHDATLRGVEVTGGKEDEKHECPGGGAKDDGKDELGGEMQCEERVAGFVATDERHGDQDAGEEDADLHKVGGGHFEGLIDADGAAEDVSATDEKQVGKKKDEAGEPWLAHDVAQGGASPAARFGGNFNKRLSGGAWRTGQIGGLGTGEHQGAALGAHRKIYTPMHSRPPTERGWHIILKLNDLRVRIPAGCGWRGC